MTGLMLGKHKTVEKYDQNTLKNAKIQLRSRTFSVFILPSCIVCPCPFCLEQSESIGLASSVRQMGAPLSTPNQQHADHWSRVELDHWMTIGSGGQWTAEVSDDFADYQQQQLQRRLQQPPLSGRLSPPPSHWTDQSIADLSVDFKQTFPAASVAGCQGELRNNR